MTQVSADQGAILALHFVGKVVNPLVQVAGQLQGQLLQLDRARFPACLELAFVGRPVGVALCSLTCDQMPPRSCARSPIRLLSLIGETLRVVVRQLDELQAVFVERAAHLRQAVAEALHQQLDSRTLGDMQRLLLRAQL